MERAGDHRARRGSVALDRPEFLDAAIAMRARDRRPARRRRPAAACQPRRSGRRQRGDPGGPRDAGDRPADAVSADGRRVVAGRRHRPARRRARAFRRPGPQGPLVRHRRRRRAADGAARRSARRRHPVRGVDDRRGAAAGRPSGSRRPRRALRRGGRRHVGQRDAHPGPAATLGWTLARSRRGRGARTHPGRGGLRPAALGIACRGARIGARRGRRGGRRGQLLRAAARP